MNRLIGLLTVICLLSPTLMADQRQRPEQAERDLLQISMPASLDRDGVGDEVRNRVAHAAANAAMLRWLIFEESERATVDTKVMRGPSIDETEIWDVTTGGRVVVFDRSPVNPNATGILRGMYRYGSPDMFPVELQIWNGISSRWPEPKGYDNGISTPLAPWYADSGMVKRSAIFPNLLNLFSFIEEKESAQKLYRSRSKQVLPVAFFVDRSLIDRYPDWKERLQMLNDIASACFARQFDTYLDLVKVFTVQMSRDTSITVDAAFNALVGGHYPGGDTISVLFYSDSTIAEGEPIGETEIGRKQIALHETRYANRADMRGWAIMQTLSLLHELGHSFGAIHVSDAYSVMNHSPTPTGAFVFDTLNATIIRAALHHEFGFADHAGYLREVTKALRMTGYRLADYPEFLTHYMTPEQSQAYATTAKAVINDDPLLLAATGLIALKQSNAAIAGGIFDAVLMVDSAMAAPWYYRGIASSDEEKSEHFIRKAADLGYYLAQELLHIRERR